MPHEAYRSRLMVRPLTAGGSPALRYRALLGDCSDAVGFGLLAGGLAVVDGYLAFTSHHLLAVALAIFPLAIWALTTPPILFVVLGASLPALMSVSGNAGGYHVAASDL